MSSLPEGSHARGFALYVGLDEETARASGISLSELAQALKKTVQELSPEAESYLTVALSSTTEGRNVDVVRRALQEPAALIRQRRVMDSASKQQGSEGVLIDISRKRVQLDSQILPLTYKEFELLQFLVLREGVTVPRTEIIATLWPEEKPSERTIDVHVRRLRAKLSVYADIVRTVRGSGYRFDRHADVTIRWAAAPSPDIF